MIEELEVILKLTRKSMRNTETLLRLPQVQSRRPLAKEVRGYLIRGLFYGDRVITTILDGNSHREYFDQMCANIDTANRRLAGLQGIKI